MQPDFITQDNLVIRIIAEPRLRWLRHLLLLLLFFVTYNNTLMTYSGNITTLGKGIIYVAFGQFILYLGVIYINIYILVPRLFLEHRYALYTVCLLTLLGSLSAVDYFTEYFIHGKYSLTPGMVSYMNSRHIVALDLVSNIAVTGMCCIGTTLTLLVRQWINDGRRRMELETEGYRSQLLKLKNSVNPAFLTDTLGKAADETLRNPLVAADILGRLSRFLRYRLYDASRNNAVLTSDISFLDNYLSLIQLVRPGFGYEIKVTGMVNAALVNPSVFKNIIDIMLDSTKADQRIWLDAEFSTQAKGIELCLTLKPDGGVAPADNGITAGMHDILRLAYPGRHELTTSSGSGEFTAKIHILKNKNRDGGAR